MIGDKIIRGTGTNWSGYLAQTRVGVQTGLTDTGCNWAPVGYWGIAGDELGLDFAYGPRTAAAPTEFANPCRTSTS